MAIRMRLTKNVTQFAKRFWITYSQIEDASDELAIKSFKQALLPGIELRKDLVRFPMVTMKALMAWVNQLLNKKKIRPELGKALAFGQRITPPRKIRNYLGGRRQTETRPRQAQQWPRFLPQRAARSPSLQGCEHHLQGADL